MNDAVIPGVGIFAGLDDQLALALERSTTRLVLQRGSRLFHEGEIGNSTFIVAQGMLKTFRLDPSGTSTLISVVYPGEVLIDDSGPVTQPRAVTAIAGTRSVVLERSEEDLGGGARNPAEVTIRILEQSCRQLQHARASLAESMTANVTTRVARLLIQLAARQAPHREGAIAVEGLTQKEMASLIGASRESVNKALADLAALGLVELRPRSVVVGDVSKLSQASIATRV